MRTGPAIAVLAVLLALAGCTPSTHGGTASPTPTATPVFASDAEALAAAEKAYAAYLAVSDQIAQDGGKDPERIADYVTADRLKVELRGFSTLEARMLHGAGSTLFSRSRLEQSHFDGLDSQVVFFTCWDASAVRVIDSTGADVTPTNRIDSRTLEIVMSTAHGQAKLLLESDDPWSASSSC